jgi:hypothetical protein
MPGKDFAAAANDITKTKRSNAVPGSEDTQDKNCVRDTSYVSTNVIHRPANYVVTGDMLSIRKIETLTTANHDDQSIPSLQAEMDATNHTDSTEYVSIDDDVYNMFFLSNIGGQAFFYTAYVF